MPKIRNSKKGEIIYDAVKNLICDFIANSDEPLMLYHNDICILVFKISVRLVQVFVRLSIFFVSSIQI